MFITKYCTFPGAKNTALSAEVQTKTPVSNMKLKKKSYLSLLIPLIQSLHTVTTGF